ncbi:hypothetical protein AB0I10_32925 [Streptomyces sp. NPDC050636]|uniref:hypothetical protein n=1 Tax=Streptomyces sp. NPDC050636 TaxID=3154510 RepID=UPI00343479F8
MEPVPALVRLDSLFINFQDFDFPQGSSHGYRWVDIKRFRVPSDMPPALPPDMHDERNVLAALIAHLEFRDTYDGGGVDPDGTRHGQWWLDRIAPDSYRAVDDTAAIGIIDTWAIGQGTLPKQLEARLRAEIYSPIRSSTDRFALGDLPKDAVHDYGPIHIDFHELVLIDRPASTVTLLVAADD